jgi:hypothetical protein
MVSRKRELLQDPAFLLLESQIKLPAFDQKNKEKKMKSRRENREKEENNKKQPKRNKNYPKNCKRLPKN